MDAFERREQFVGEYVGGEVQRCTWFYMAQGSGDDAVQPIPRDERNLNCGRMRAAVTVGGSKGGDCVLVHRVLIQLTTSTEAAG